jgi:hypothetical protein
MKAGIMKSKEGFDIRNRSYKELLSACALMEALLLCGYRAGN